MAGRSQGADFSAGDRIYRLRAAVRVGVWFLSLLALILGVAWVVAGSGVVGFPRTSQSWFLIPAGLLLLILGAGLAWYPRRTFLVLRADGSFRIPALFGRQEHRRSDYAAFSRDQTGYALRNAEGRCKLVVDGWFDGREEIESWLAASLRDLDRERKEVFLARYDEARQQAQLHGVPAPDVASARRWLATLTYVAIALFAAQLAILRWLGDKSGLWELSVSLAGWTIMALSLWVAYRNRTFVDFFGSVPATCPSYLSPVLSAAFALMLPSVFSPPALYPMFDLVAAGGAGVAFWWIAQRPSAPPNKVYERYLSFAVITVLCGYALSHSVNRAVALKPPTHYPARILELRVSKNHDCTLVLSSWGPVAGPRDYSLRGRQCARFQDADSVDVIVSQGLLGVPWVRQVRKLPSPQTAPD